MPDAQVEESRLAVALRTTLSIRAVAPGATAKRIWVPLLQPPFSA